MSAFGSAWRSLDLPLRRFLAVNAAGILSATAALLAIYLAGVHHEQMRGDLLVLAVADLVLLSVVPLTIRHGAAGAVLSVAASTIVFALGATWVTPFLAPLTVLAVLVPVMVAYPYLGRRSMLAITGAVVVVTAGLAAVAEWRRSYADTPHLAMAVISLALFVPAVVVVIAYAVGQNYRRLAAQAAELQESRTRVAAVADAARRGLERDLHDGAQQRLVGMSVRIAGLERALAAGESPAGARTAVRELAEENLAAIAELRELARGIYPPLLAERGLVAALNAAARRSALPCSVIADPVGRWQTAVESAVYFCVLEALQNAAKHSGAVEVQVGLRAAPDLEFLVRDDGAGFEAAAVERSGGILGMEARVAAADGQLWVDSAPGAGATVRGRFPATLRVPD